MATIGASNTGMIVYALDPHERRLSQFAIQVRGAAGFARQLFERDVTG